MTPPRVPASTTTAGAGGGAGAGAGAGAGVSAAGTASPVPPTLGAQIPATAAVPTPAAAASTSTTGKATAASTAAVLPGAAAGGGGSGGATDKAQPVAAPGSPQIPAPPDVRLSPIRPARTLSTLSFDSLTDGTQQDDAILEDAFNDMEAT